MTSTSSSPGARLGGEDRRRVGEQPARGRGGERLRMRGWPCPRLAFQVMLPRSHQRAPSAVVKRAPWPPTISSGTALVLRRSRCRRRARPAACRGAARRRGWLTARVSRDVGQAWRRPRRSPRACASVQDERGESRIAFLPHSSTSRPAPEAELRDGVGELGVRSRRRSSSPTPRTSVTPGMPASARRRACFLSRAPTRAELSTSPPLEQIDRRQRRPRCTPGCPRSSSRGCRPARS